jgi:hypothetical protein
MAEFDRWVAVRLPGEAEQFQDRIGKTQGMALSTTRPRKASSSVCHQATPFSAGGAAVGVAAISKACSPHPCRAAPARREGCPVRRGVPRQPFSARFRAPAELRR